jgi:hypothetical protein
MVARIPNWCGSRLRRRIVRLVGYAVAARVGALNYSWCWALVQSRLWKPRCLLASSIRLLKKS